MSGPACVGGGLVEGRDYMADNAPPRSLLPVVLARDLIQSICACPPLTLFGVDVGVLAWAGRGAHRRVRSFRPRRG